MIFGYRRLTKEKPIFWDITLVDTLSKARFFHYSATIFSNIQNMKSRPCAQCNPARDIKKKLRDTNSPRVQNQEQPLTGLPSSRSILSARKKSSDKILCIMLMSLDPIRLGQNVDAGKKKCPKRRNKKNP